MPIDIEFDKAQVDAIKENFRKIQDRIKHGKPFFQRSAIRMHRGVMQHFSDEMGSTGAWAPLQKERKRGGSKVLQDTGILRASVRFQGEDDNARVHTDLVYAARHNDGHGATPRREFMWMSPELRKSIMGDMAVWISDGRL